MQIISDIIDNPNAKRRGLLVFSIYWLVVFVLYLPAAQAGRVGDFPGWVDFLNSVNFWDYINRSNSTIPSTYQFTQIVTYFFYQFFKGHAWPWHLLYVTMQAINAALAYSFFRRLFLDSGIKNAVIVAFSGSLLFCACPHISEVVVWEPSFHYLFALILMLSILISVQCYCNTPDKKYLWQAGIVFFLSTFSLEIFYLTPLFVATLAIYKYALGQCDRRTFLQVLLYCLLPEIILFIGNQVLLHFIYHQKVAHIGLVSLLFSSDNFSKSLKYIFHILFFGRYFPGDVRNKVYDFCESTLSLSVFYGIVIFVLAFIAFSYRKMTNSGKTVVLLFIWLLFAFGLVFPLSFPEGGLCILDRYTYVIDAMIYVFLVLLLNVSLSKRMMIAVTVAYVLVNIRYTHKVNAYWQQSAAVVNNLVYTFPNDPTKTVLLLNLPECFDGVQMVGSRDDGEFRMMYNAIMPNKITNTVHDVEAFYVSTPMDGAHVKVIDDTTIHVTLNQWGTWWLYYGFGATNYENKDYKVNMRDVGHWYELVIKRPASEYIFLYQVAGQWKKADWAKKNVDQY